MVRKAKPEVEGQTVRISLLVTPSMKVQMDRATALSGMAQTELVRRALALFFKTHNIK